MSNYTPGPWEVHGEDSIVVKTSEKTKSVVAFATGIKIHEETTKANAHLIAAAPELIDNLWKIVLKFHADVVDGTLNPTKELLALIWEAETLVFRINHGEETTE